MQYTNVTQNVIAQNVIILWVVRVSRNISAYVDEGQNLCLRKVTNSSKVFQEASI